MNGQQNKTTNTLSTIAKRKLFTGILLGLICGLIGGHFITKYILTTDSISREYVCIRIINSSENTIKKLIIKHDNEAYEINQLPADKEKTIVFRNPGEGLYNVTVIFENNTILESKDKYIEGGYRLTETITAKEIKTNYE